MKKLFSALIAALLIIIVSFAVFAEVSKDDITVTVTTAKAETLPSVDNLCTTKKLNGDIDISWDTLDEADAYRVYVKDTKDKKYTLCRTVKTNKATVKGPFSPNVKFKVRALRFEEKKVISGKLSQAVGLISSPKGVDTLHTRSITDNSITLYWSKAEDATGYRIYVSDEKQDKFVLYTRTPRTTATVSGLKKDTLYTFRILSYKKVNGSISFGTYSEDYKEYTYNSGGIPHTTAQCAQYYNNHIAKLKAQQNMEIKYKKTIGTEFISCSRKNLAVSVKNTLSLFDGALSKTYRYVGGKSEDKSANKLIEPYGKTASLEKDDIREYTAEKSGNDIIIRVCLKNENKIYNKGEAAAKSYYDGVLSMPDYKKLNTSPLSIEKADSYYSGGTLTLKVTDRKISVFKISAAVLSDIEFSVSDVTASTVIGYELTERYEVRYTA